MKTAIFVDGANTYSAALRLDTEIDYMKVLEKWNTPPHDLLRAFYYTAIRETYDKGPNPVRNLGTFLSFNGYRVVTKMGKQFGDGTFKGNMDIEIAVGMLRTSRHIDHAVLFSGDGDFRSLVEAVQDDGVRVTVISTIKSSPPTCAEELRKQADSYLDLTDLPDICRPRKPKV